jgi:hypothetical protein
MTALLDCRGGPLNRIAEKVSALLPIPRRRAIVPYLHLLTFLPPPSYSRHTSPARQDQSVPVVRWLDGYDGMIQLKVVTIFSGKTGTGKTALICNIIADLTRRGKHVVI